MIQILQMHKPLNLPGPGIEKRWVANGVDGTFRGTVKHIVRDECGYWMLVPSGGNAGWYHVPFTAIEFAKGIPPQDVLDVVKAREKAKAAPPIAEPPPAAA